MKLVRYSLSMVSISTELSNTSETLQCAVGDDNIDWVRFCLESRANPTLKHDCSEHLILATAAFFASTEISELLIKWRAEIEASSALNIASHKGNADPVKLLLKHGADANEMSIDDQPADLEETALHLIERDGRISCRSYSIMVLTSTRKIT